MEDLFLSPSLNLPFQVNNFFKRSVIIYVVTMLSMNSLHAHIAVCACLCMDVVRVHIYSFTHVLVTHVHLLHIQLYSLHDTGHIPVPPMHK